MTGLGYADVLRYAAEHPGMDPAAIGQAMTRAMTKAQLRAYAVAEVRAIVENHRRYLARQAEDRAEAEASRQRAAAQQAERDRQRAELDRRNREAGKRWAAQEAERVRQAVARLTSDETFQQLYDDPVATVGKYDDYDTPGSVGPMFRDWCGDRFGPWFQRTRAMLEQASAEAYKHGRYECGATLGNGGQCHNRAGCRLHGSPPPPPEYGNLLHVLEEKFYPGGGLMLIMDKWRAEVVAQTRLEVTEELLATKVALGDGTMVTWGEATVAQHQQRVDMLVAGAAGTMETAARHQVAINMIKAAGVSCLGDLAGPGSDDD